MQSRKKIIFEDHNGFCNYFVTTVIQPFIITRVCNNSHYQAREHWENQIILNKIVHCLVKCRCHSNTPPSSLLLEQKRSSLCFISNRTFINQTALNSTGNKLSTVLPILTALWLILKSASHFNPSIWQGLASKWGYIS